MQTDLTADEYEALGRETAGRLGKHPKYRAPKWDDASAFIWLSQDLKIACEDDSYCRIPELLLNITGRCHSSERDAYIALGRAVHACRLAVGYYDAVAAERERAAKVLDFRHEYYQHLALKCGYGTDSDFYHADQCAQEDAHAIRKGAHHD